MQAFHGDEKVKQKYLARVQAHFLADEIVKGKYWEGGKGCAVGCAVGCTIHSSEHASYVHLYLEEWCDKSLPYPDMCAEACRRAKSAYDALVTELSLAKQDADSWKRSHKIAQEAGSKLVDERDALAERLKAAEAERDEWRQKAQQMGVFAAMPFAEHNEMLIKERDQALERVRNMQNQIGLYNRESEDRACEMAALRAELASAEKGRDKYANAMALVMREGIFAEKRKVKEQLEEILGVKL